MDSSVLCKTCFFFPPHKGGMGELSYENKQLCLSINSQTFHKLQMASWLSSAARVVSWENLLYFLWQSDPVKTYSAIDI